MAGPAYFDAFRRIVVQPDNITISADAVDDTLTLVAGAGISLVANAGSDQITIVNTNTSSPTNDLFARRLTVDGIVIDTNVIRGTDSNADLELDANGTGAVSVIGNLKVSGTITAGNINNLVVNDLGGGTSLTAGSQLQIGNSADIAGAGVIIKNAVTNTLSGVTSLEGGSKIQMDNGNVSLFSYTYSELSGGEGLEGRLGVEVDNSYLNNVVRIGTRVINTTGGSTTTSFQGITISQYGNITFPDATVQSTAYNPSNIRSEGNINIDVNLSDSTLRRWQFGEDGNLTLPQGGNISEGGGISGAIKLTPAGGANEYQALLIYPTAGEGDHIHLTAGGGTTELYLGDDLHYVKLASDGNIRIQADNGVNGAAWTFGTDGSLQIPGDITSEGNINIEINLSDSTLRRWQFGEDGLLTFPDGTSQTTAYTSVYAQSGATSAYATQRVLQYNPSTNAVTYSNYIDATSIYVTGYSSEIHVSPVAFDDSGKGTIGDPVKTIARAKVLAAAAFETTGVGQRKTIILHPGDYSENVTIDTQFTVLTSHELIGKNTTISGTVTVTTGCSIEGLKMTNLVISATSATGSVDIVGCTVSTATTKTSSAYVNFRACDLSSSSLSITGAGTTLLVGGNYGTVTVNNASAGVLAKAVITMGPVTLTAGTLQLSDTLIYSATNTSNAITQSAGSFLTVNNCQTLIPDLTNVSRNSFGGYYSILHSVYDKTNSTFGGTSLNAIEYSQYINADRLILSSGGQITFPDASVQTKAWAGIPGPYADDAAAAAASVAVGYPYHKTGTGGQVFVRLA